MNDAPGHGMLIGDLMVLVEQGRIWLSLVFFTFLRVGGAMAVMPAFGEVLIPVRVRLGLTVAFSVVVAPALGTDALLPALSQTAPTGLLTEPLIGLAIGIMLRLFVLGLLTAGSMIAQSISLSQLFGGTGGEPQPAIGTLLSLGGLTLAAHLGLPVKIAGLLIGSYDVIGPGQLPDPDVLFRWGVAGVARCFALAFSVAMPFVLGGLLYNIALGAINRAMPQLMVSLIGAPALTFGGLSLLVIAVPGGLALWHGAFDAFLADPFGGAP